MVLPGANSLTVLAVVGHEEVAAGVEGQGEGRSSPVRVAVGVVDR